MNGITCKFGGTSLADAACMRSVEAIIRANPERRFIVPSAPGKRRPDDKKITDLLLAWHSLASKNLDASQPAGIIRERFTELARDLGVRFDIEPLLDEIAACATQYPEPDFMASRGEFLNGRLIAEFLGATFVDPAECIRFDVEGQLDPAATDDLLGARLQGPRTICRAGLLRGIAERTHQDLLAWRQRRHRLHCRTRFELAALRELDRRLRISHGRSQNRSRRQTH